MLASERQQKGTSGFWQERSASDGEGRLRVTRFVATKSTGKYFIVNKTRTLGLLSPRINRENDEKLSPVKTRNVMYTHYLNNTPSTTTTKHNWTLATDQTGAAA